MCIKWTQQVLVFYSFCTRIERKSHHFFFSFIGNILQLLGSGRISWSSTSPLPCCGFKAHASALFGHFFISRDHPSECKYSPLSPRLASRFCMLPQCFYNAMQWYSPLLHPFHDILSFPTSYLPFCKERNFQRKLAKVKISVLPCRESPS